MEWDEFPAPAPNGEVVYFMSDRQYANVICDPGWSALQVIGSPSEAGFVLGIPGTPLCASGDMRLRWNAQQQTIERRSNFDGYLMGPDGDRRVIRLTPDGNAVPAYGSWSPDSTELSVGPAAFDTKDITILTFKHTQ